EDATSIADLPSTGTTPLPGWPVSPSLAELAGCVLNPCCGDEDHDPSCIPPKRVRKMLHRYMDYEVTTNAPPESQGQGQKCK
ncbi:unnamed protein product, partial [Closterium sp. NIES-53]